MEIIQGENPSPEISRLQVENWKEHEIVSPLVMVILVLSKGWE